MMKVSHGIILAVLMFAFFADGMFAFLIPHGKQQGDQDDLSSPGLDYCICSGKGLSTFLPEGNAPKGKRSREVIHYLQDAMDLLPYYRGGAK